MIRTVRQEMASLNLKRCAGCGEVQHAEMFHAHKNGLLGRDSKCKRCKLEAMADRRLDSRVIEMEKLYAERHRDDASRRARRWRANNKTKILAQKKAWKEKNTGRVREYFREYQRRRRRMPHVILNQRVSRRLRWCLGADKGWLSAKNIVGWTMEELAKHLERQFTPGMSWENMSEWHIDHIVPLSAFSINAVDDSEMKRAWALSNLRPLWRRDNQIKGSRREYLL